MANLSKEEIQARIEASKAKREPRERIDNTDLLKASGLRVVHIKPLEGGVAAGRNGMTVAFRQKNGGPVIEVATALCKKGDTFSRKVGTKTAIESFQEGKTMFLPLARLDCQDPVGNKYVEYPAIDTLIAYFRI